MSTPAATPDPPAPNGDTTPSPALEIGPRLAAYRAQRGIKVSALARAVGVSASLISQIERGQSRPSVSTLLALADTLDVAVDAFFRDPHDEDDPSANRAGPADGDARAYDDGQVVAEGDGDEVQEAKPDDVEGRRQAGGEGGPQGGGEGAPRRGGGERGPDGAWHGRGANRYLVRRCERAAIAIEGGVRWERLTPIQLAELEFMELVYSPGAESHATQYRHPGMEMVLVLDGRLDIYVGFERYQLEQGDSLCFPSTTPHRYLNPTDQTTRAVTVILPDGGTPQPPATDRGP